MALTAVRPSAPPDTGNPPLYSPKWHRQEEEKERVWLDAYARWCHRFRALPVSG